MIRPPSGWLASSLVIVALGCNPPSPAAAPGAAALDAAASYEIAVADGGRRLQVEAVLTSASTLLLDETVAPFAKDVALHAAGGWTKVAAAEVGTWPVPTCTHGCRVRYRFDLEAAAAALADASYAEALGDAWQAPPSSYLLRPAGLATFRFHVRSAPGVEYLTGVLDDPRTIATYQGVAADVNDLPFTAVGRLRRRSMQIAGSSLEVGIAGAVPAVGDERIFAWVGQGAANVAAYLGRLPLRRAAVIVVVGRGRHVGSGTTMGHGGATIELRVGARTAEDELASDWKMTHELIHVSMPNLAGPQRWLEEGVATYVEPLARARRGLLDPKQLWVDFARDMPNGLPEPGAGGLDDTRTWGSTYWGGALFSFTADLEIRARTGGQKSLDDALRAIAAAGGNAAVTWPIERVVEVGDRGTGTHVLSELYQRAAHQPLHVDLPALWRRLGVNADGSFDDGAPLSTTRRALTSAQ